MASLMDPIYRAIESGDLESIERLLASDVFMFTPEADGVLLSRDEVVSYAAERFERIRAGAGAIRLEAEPVTYGEDPGGHAAWAFDLVSIWIADRTEGVLPTRVRVTALLARGADGWGVAACYWSLPYVTQADQDAVKAAGLLEPGVRLPEPDPEAVAPYVPVLTRALAEPRLLPELYSTREGQATIGSVVDEIFLGPAARAAWEEFVGFVSSFTLRGPVRAAVVTEDLGWLAANIEVGQPPTPYRFFYVWLREAGQWRIVVSHDSVSRSLEAASFR